MDKVEKWRCSSEPTHIFDEYGDGFCHRGVPHHGILMPIKGPVGPEVGLSVILMDASSSMSELAFEDIMLTRTQLISASAASGIFDLERMQSNPYAYVAAFKFDDRVELMFVESVASLLERFDKNAIKFSNYLNEELEKMQRGTDINLALQEAYQFVDKFLNKELPDFPIKDYEPMKQIILNEKGESLSVANVRVLIYTDGMQYDAKKGKVLHDNPFKKKPLPDLNLDVVTGVFFGQETDDGCQELQGLLSKCPTHDVLQFFLFDSPTKIGVLRNLFRMASGASGFCPRCISKELKRE
jgi:hypothetical protein